MTCVLRIFLTFVLKGEIFLNNTIWTSGFVAVDIETTGFSPVRDSIVEVGAIRFVPGKHLDFFQTFVKPECPIPSRVIAVHGITNEMVQNAPSMMEISNEFMDFIGGNPLVIHNAPFDLGFLRPVIKRTINRPILNSVFDTYRLSQKAFPGLKSYKLSELARNFGFLGDVQHRALEDCKYCASLFEKILEVIDGLKCMSSDELISEYSYH